MKIKCKVQEIINSLGIVFKSSSSKTTMPILEGVLIETLEDSIKLTTYDLEIGVETIIPCDVIESGKTVIDIKLLNEILRKLETDEVSLDADENIFTITSDNGIFKLTVMDPNEYPRLPVFSVENWIELEQKVLKNMIRKILFAVSNDETRAIYTGALVKVEDNLLTIVALDGFRLALKKYVSTSNINNFQAIIPGKVLNELTKILSDLDDLTIKIGINKNQALFKSEKTTIISRLIEGEFLNYTNIIPSNFETKVKVKTKSLLDSFERVALFSKENTDKDKKSPVKMNINVDGIMLSCISQTGDAKENLTAVVEGNEIEIGFNPKFFIDVLKVIDDPEIYIEFTSNISPVLIKPIVDNDFIYVVLPIKLRQ